MQRVDFHVLAGADARERLRYACRVVEKACLAEQRVLVWFDSDEELAAFDELLWSFGDRSFVPHEVLAATPDWDEAPAWLGGPRASAAGSDVLLNLAATVPEAAAQAGRVIEIIDADAERRRSGRERFRAYRERGIEPVTHTIGGAAG
ncbi:MAG: DNA polymerase III subunit chi [Gammaproteobacteria bacterium]|nr:DNA polymerase III subunit chi [Gammaproteobacteria bacterium]